MKMGRAYPKGSGDRTLEKAWNTIQEPNAKRRSNHKAQYGGVLGLRIGHLHFWDTGEKASRTVYSFRNIGQGELGRKR